jgi:eukaryotic-like serine/threonine-protein kinase
MWLTSRLIDLQSSDGEKPYDLAYKLASAIVRLELALHEDHLQAASSIDNMTRAAQAARWLSDARGQWSDKQLSQTAQASLAVWYEERGQFPQAEEAWTVVIHDLEGWNPEQPHRSDQLQYLGHARLRRAECRMRSSREGEVESDFRQAIVDLNAAWQLTDGDAFFRTNLATAQLRLASLQDEGDSAAQQESLRLMQSARRIYGSLANENPNAGTIRPLARIDVVIADLNLRMGRQDVLENLEAALLGFQWLFDNQQMVARDLELWRKSIETSRQTLSNAQRALLQRARLCEQKFSKANASAERASENPTSADFTSN